MEGSLINVHLSRSLIRFADRPVKDRKRSKSFCGSTANVVCVYFCTFWAYYTQYLSWFRTAKTSLPPPLHHAMCPKSKRRACALRTQERFPTEWKRKTKPEFYLERFLWTVRMRRIRLEHFMVSFGCLLTFTLSSLHAIFKALFITLKDFVHLMSTIINHEHIIQQLLNSVATHPLINLLIHLIHWPTKCKQARTSKALNKLLIPQ